MQEVCMKSMKTTWSGKLSAAWKFDLFFKQEREWFKDQINEEAPLVYGRLRPMKQRATV